LASAASVIIQWVKCFCSSAGHTAAVNAAGIGNYNSSRVHGNLVWLSGYLDFLLNISTFFYTTIISAFAEQEMNKISYAGIIDFIYIK
jgi:hypothetical protein